MPADQLREALNKACGPRQAGYSKDLFRASVGKGLSFFSWLAAGIKADCSEWPMTVSKLPLHAVESHPSVNYLYNLWRPAECISAIFRAPTPASGLLTASREGVKA